MRVLGSVLVLGLALASTVAVPAEAAKEGKAGKRHFNLAWRPTDTPDAEVVDLTGLGSVRLKVEPLEDGRADRTSIGVNREKKSAPVTTDSDVGAFVTEAMRSQLRGAGFVVADEGPTHVLKGSIQEFEVLLDGTYKSKVRVRLSLSDASGKELWTGLMSGSNTRFSMLESSESYLESLSDALLEAVSGLVRSESFVAALRG